MSERPPRPVRPRDAASVVLVRGHGPAAEVLMGRRRSRAAFLPNVYVFPGGRVDRDDVVAGRQIDQPAATMDLLGRRRRGTHGLLVAALRETFEETGLLLVEQRPFAPPPAFAEAPLWRALAALGAAPALGHLVYVGRAITPTLSPRRFNTRFFMADAACARGELVTDGELLDLRWVRLAEAPRILPVVDVTGFVLTTVARHLEGRPSERVPLWRYIGDRSHVLYE